MRNFKGNFLLKVDSSTIQVQYIFMICSAVLELNSKNRNNALFGNFSTIMLYVKEVSYCYQI